MAILTKVKGNKKVFDDVFLHLGGYSCYKIEGETYYSFFPYQALALQKLGVELEFYRANGIIQGLPIVPEGTKVEKMEGLKPCVDEKEKLNKFVEKLKKKLKESDKHDSFKLYSI